MSQYLNYHSHLLNKGRPVSCQSGTVASLICGGESAGVFASYTNQHNLGNYALKVTLVGAEARGLGEVGEKGVEGRGGWLAAR